MIKSKRELKEYIAYEKKLYINCECTKKVAAILAYSYRNLTYKYIVNLRKEEYYYNVKKGLISTIGQIYYHRKKRKIGTRLGIDIGRNAFGKGLHILHPFNIIVNGDAHIGNDCTLHGSVCIGNKGDSQESVPAIGNNVDIGWGSVIVGKINIADDCVIGANSFVNKSFDKEGAIIGGNPAKLLKYKEEYRNG